MTEFLFRKTGSNRAPWAFAFPQVPPAAAAAPDEPPIRELIGISRPILGAARTAVVAYSVLMSSFVPPDDPNASVSSSQTATAAVVRRTALTAYQINATFVPPAEVDEPNASVKTLLPDSARTAQRTATQAYQINATFPPAEAEVNVIVPHYPSSARRPTTASSAYQINATFPPAELEPFLIPAHFTTAAPGSRRTSNAAYSIQASFVVPDVIIPQALFVPLPDTVLRPRRTSTEIYLINTSFVVPDGPFIEPAPVEVPTGSGHFIRGPVFSTPQIRGKMRGN